MDSAVDNPKLGNFTHKDRYHWDKGEYFWVEHQPFLLSRGYRLRPRYDPNWIPSWPLNTIPFGREDAISAGYANVLDAVRIKDNKIVVLKKIRTWTDELPVALYLSSDGMRSDPRNRAMPLLDVILLPDDDECALIVMPLLRVFDTPPFARRGEVIEALRQFLQGIEFLHENSIAHRDACWTNLMMDHTRVIPNGFHPQKPWSHDGVSFDFTWKPRYSVAPIDYYIIDFGLTSWFQYPGQTSMSTGIFGQDKTVPELSETVPYDAYKVDIYQLGRVINMLIKTYSGYLNMLKPLSREMTLKEPAQRPTASQALKTFDSIVSAMSKRQQRTRIKRSIDTPWRRFFMWVNSFPNL